MTKVRPFHPALVTGAEVHHGDIVAWQYGGTAPPESADARGPHPTFYRQVKFAHSSNDIINWKVCVSEHVVLVFVFVFHFSWVIDRSLHYSTRPAPRQPPLFHNTRTPLLISNDERARRRRRTSRGTTVRAMVHRPRKATLSRGWALTNSLLCGTNLGPLRSQRPFATRAARMGPRTGPKGAMGSISGAVGQHRPGSSLTREEGVRHCRPLHSSAPRRASSR